LKQAITELRGQYTLGFIPSSPGKEGIYHRLVVKFKSDGPCPGCHIQARRGYYAGIQQSFRPVNYSKSPVPPDKRVEPSAYNRIIAAATDASERKEIAFKVSMARDLSVAGRSQMKVDLEIDPAGVSFKTVGDRHVGRLTIAIFCTDPAGAYLGTDWKIMDLQLREDTYRRFLDSSIPFSSTIPLWVQRQVLKVVVYDEQSGSVGSKLVRT
jgi:hypothetical protein